MERNFQSTVIEFVQGDITRAEVDGIVNAANSSLLGGGGVDGAIHRAGGSEILEECKKIRARQGGCPVGEAVITMAGRLPAKYVIHTVGPVWNGGQHEEEAKLHSCYIQSLALADQYELESVAFPNISTGIYGFPKTLAAPIAIRAVKEFLSAHPQTTIKKVQFVCFDEENEEIYRKLLEQDAELLIHRYIEAYNSFDIEGMLSVLHPDVIFRNIVGNEVTVETNGLQSFRALAEKAAALFSIRHQTILELREINGRIEADIDYTGVLASDLPDGVKAGDTIRLQGRSIFMIRDGKLSLIEDYS
ncbi:O-acetyl-ADP-ribose deacetylase (regulator of RNase III) [Paenibacillus sp. OAE614]